MPVRVRVQSDDLPDEEPEVVRESMIPRPPPLGRVAPWIRPRPRRAPSATTRAWWTSGGGSRHRRCTLVFVGPKFVGVLGLGWDRARPAIGSGRFPAVRWDGAAGSSRASRGLDPRAAGGGSASTSAVCGRPSSPSTATNERRQPGRAQSRCERWPQRRSAGSEAGGDVVIPSTSYQRLAGVAEYSGPRLTWAFSWPRRSPT